MKRRRLLALLALAAALVAAGATAELDQVFERGAFAPSASDAASSGRVSDSLVAPGPQPHPAAVGMRGARANGLDHAFRAGTAVLAAAALLAALASRRLGRPSAAPGARTYGTTSLSRGPPQLLAT